MEFAEYLKRLEEETQKLISSDEARRKEKERIEPLLAKVDEEYNTEFEILRKAYHEACDALAQKREGDISEISKQLEKNKSICDENRQSVEQAKLAILDGFKIDNELMCGLLEKQTGLKWKVLMIEGLMADTMWGGCLHRYGFVLIDETSPFFNEGTVHLFPDDVVETSSHLILGEDCGTSDERKANIYRASTPTKNWMKRYLLQKRKLHDDPEYFGFDHKFDPDPDLDILVKAIDTYLENPLILESSGKEETQKQHEDLARNKK